MSRKRLFSILSVLLVLSMFFAACSPQQPAATEQPDETAAEPAQDEQVLRLSLFQEPNTLDWQRVTANIELYTLSWVMDGLTRYKHGKIIPALAEKWDISDDGKVYTFHLRDAKWTDGQPVKADDFKYGWLRALDPADPMDYAYFLYDIVGAQEFNSNKGKAEDVAIKVIDDKTLEVTLKRPVTYFDYLVSFATYYPTRKDIVEKYGTKFNAEAENFVTCGPFKVETWKHESEMTFVKNMDYWNASEIKLEKIIGPYIADDQTEFNMYEAEELDMTIALNGDQKAALTKGGVKQFNNGSTWFFNFNVAHPILKNLNIRKALTLGIDRKSFIENVAKRPWKPAFALVQPDIIPDADENKTFREVGGEYFKDNDIETAKQLLEQGMKELGLTKMPKFKFMCNDNATGQLYAQAFQEMWKKNLNVETELEPVPSSVRIDRQSKHDFEISLGGWGPDYPDPMTDLDLYTSWSGNNDPGYYNVEYDELIKKAQNEPDRVEKFKLMHQAEDILMRDLPIGPIWYGYTDYAIREYVKGVYKKGVGVEVDVVYAYIEGKNK
ncbi:peptide ABC transporter substrate-binding protein [Lutispora saccharofermentans]|uniref:Peptide ABC transporter substrate-binding protein n=1 Tax=Lutispora saccharofermentans TaxID=3024236 RepID=A0ABT1NGG6_9FIRM|nr:peptide ABC transporter substrate-binding protein [Lutispora saccharofermentans]